MKLVFLDYALLLRIERRRSKLISKTCFISKTILVLESLVLLVQHFVDLFVIENALSSFAFSSVQRLL
jgi:hypothetical protein